MGVVGQRHAPAAVRRGKTPGSHCKGGQMVPRDGQNAAVTKVNIYSSSGNRTLFLKSPTY
jgi:hypothetical protein